MHHAEALQNPWAGLPHISEAEPLGEADGPLVDDLVAVLKKHNALSRFGLTLLHKHFELEDGEVLVETTDRENRSQNIAPQFLSDVMREPIIQTAWRLDSGKPIMSCVCVNFGGDHSHQHRPCDAALKEDIAPLKGALQQIEAVSSYSFRYNERGKCVVSPSMRDRRHFGFIAQEFEETFPDLVSRKSEIDGEMRAVDYVGLVPILAQAVKELSAEVKALKELRR